ncbi:hypothetical protein ACTJJ0_03460 [Chitinophaga sp. 22321]|uniref:Uncharacterized protein n=1 Tax=Chitinophaga hostae TaxID=2831022 RepID=A0ABS5IXV9_9BACT|nr:hypothetical protein [Chitinophaga hostae]MBS0027700.1 hypothetical protein [Chitinophaga hostae]
MARTAIVKNSFAGITAKSRTLCDVIDFHNRRFCGESESREEVRRTLKRFEITKEKVIAFLKAQYH